MLFGETFVERPRKAVVNGLLRFGIVAAGVVDDALAAKCARAAAETVAFDMLRSFLVLENDFRMPSRLPILRGRSAYILIPQ